MCILLDKLKRGFCEWLDKRVYNTCERQIKKNGKFYEEKRKEESKKESKEESLKQKLVVDLEKELFAIKETKYFFKNGVFATFIPFAFTIAIAVAVMIEKTGILAFIIFIVGVMLCGIWEIFMRPRAHREIKFREEQISRQLKEEKRRSK